MVSLLQFCWYFGEIYSIACQLPNRGTN